ncbi:MAG TPA: hypothetical protein VHF86_08380 [Xanthomonadaceae bacterium]|nr:hypothetical protein [Xanthomonadaceae bacterium]
MRMTIRTMLAALFGVALAACSTLGRQALFGDSVAFTAPELQRQLDRRFPRDYDELGGLLRLRVLNPRVSIPPGDDRLRLDFDIALALPGQSDADQDGGRPAGHLAVSSGLRWNSETRGLHLDAPALESADVPQLGGAVNATGRELVDRWLQDYARREPVYQFDAGLLQRIASRRIDATTIANGQVVVHLGQ